MKITKSRINKLANAILIGMAGISLGDVLGAPWADALPVKVKHLILAIVLLVPPVMKAIDFLTDPPENESRPD